MRPASAGKFALDGEGGADGLQHDIAETRMPDPVPDALPMPPLRLREESDTPMMVRMNEAKEEAMRL